MKIAICSDLHLEFAPMQLENPGDVEVLILGGDICVAEDLIPYARDVTDSRFNNFFRFHDFFQACGDRFPHVLYVAGNHEHYGGDYADTLATLKTQLAHIKNLHVLDKEVFELEDTVFVGGTLWTDMNKQDPMTLLSIPRMMNDFKYITNRDSPLADALRWLPKFRPEDAVVDHRLMLDFIDSVYTELPLGKPMVVVGHHSPSLQSNNAARFPNQILCGGYHSELSEFILDRPRIKLWTHGHTHEPFDYMIGDTRVVCNPRGYTGHDAHSDSFKLKVIEL